MSGVRIRDRDSFDVVVVGAGLAGCSAALHLALERPELRVALLEADTVAAGASGRGTGLLGPRLGPPPDVARRRDGSRIAAARYRRSVAAVQRVLALAARYAPAAVQPCEGQLVVGFTPAEQATARRRAAAYADLGLPVALVRVGDRAAPADADTSALHYPTAAGADPAALTAGLARVALDAGVVLASSCPVTGLETVGDHTQVITPAGVLEARAVVTTVDVAAPGLGLRLGDQLELQVCATATEPLPDLLLHTLGGTAGCHVLSAAALGAYRRITPEGRLVLGGGPVSPVAGRSAPQLDRSARAGWAWQRAWLAGLHPDFADVALTHHWRGRIGLTRDELPVLARVPGRAEVWYAGGWNGHGLAATVEAGALLAERVLERRAPRPVAGFGGGVRWALAHPAVGPLVRAYLASQVPRPGSSVSRGRTAPPRVGVS